MNCDPESENTVGADLLDRLFQKKKGTTRFNMPRLSSPKSLTRMILNFPSRSASMTTLQIDTSDLSIYEGYRIRQAGHEPVFIVIDGKRHWVPNNATHYNLFGENGNIHEVVDINVVPHGSALSNGAILARPNNSSNVFLITNGLKHHLASPSVMSKFGFEGIVRVVPSVLIDFIRTGHEIL